MSRLDLAGQVKHMAPGGLGFHQRTGRVTCSGPGAGYHYTQLAGDTGVAVGHIDRSWLAAVGNHPDTTPPGYGVVNRDIVNTDNPKNGIHPRRLERRYD